MFNQIEETVENALSSANINAVRKYPADKLNRKESIVCVSLKEAELLSSGLGNYVGIAAVSGVRTEFYANRTELSVALELFAPTPADCESLRGNVHEALCKSDLKIKQLRAGEIRWDFESEMFRCDLMLYAWAYFVRKLNNGTIGAPEFVTEVP